MSSPASGLDERRQVRFTVTADEQVERQWQWWQDNRDYPHVFLADLADALDRIATLPASGTLYLESGVPNLRRVYMVGIGSHLYYTFDDQEVLVHALWSARRQHGPHL